MKIKSLLLIAILAINASCIKQDLARNLSSSYSEDQAIGIRNIDFKDLESLKRGQSCTYKIFYLIPTGSDSVMDSARNGGIANVKFIGKEGFWSVLFSKNCTVVYGD